MKKAFLAILILGLMLTSLLIAQEGEGEEAEMPETTTFYFGGHLESDLLMVESVARFETRAPLGTVIGLAKGTTGEVTLWLDSLMLVAQDVPEEENQVDLIETEAADVGDVAGEAGEGLETEAGLEEIDPDTLPIETGEEEAEAEAEEDVQVESAIKDEPAIQKPVPAGYSRPLASFEIPLGDLMTGSTIRDDMLTAEDMLNVANYPNATFQLTSIQDPSSYQLEDNLEISLIASGDLTIKDSTKRINNIQVYMTYIEAENVTEQNTGIPGDILHISASFNFKLSDFGIPIAMENLLTMDDQVSVTFEGFGSTSPFTATTEQQ